MGSDVLFVNRSGMIALQGLEGVGEVFKIG